jgi:uncharacterized protein
MNPTDDVGGLDALPGAEPAPRAGERLESRVVVLWLVTGLVRAALLSFALVYGADSFRAEAGLPDWATGVVWASAAFLLVAAIVAPPWAYATWRFAADDRLLSMRHGMIFVEDRRIPVPRMQHVDITRGPVERLFGLATLVVYTAGNEGSAFRVPGLSNVRAEALRDGIMRARGRYVV